SANSACPAGPRRPTFACTTGSIGSSEGLPRKAQGLLSLGPGLIEPRSEDPATGLAGLCRSSRDDLRHDSIRKCCIVLRTRRVRGVLEDRLAEAGRLRELDIPADRRLQDRGAAPR